MDYSIIIEKDSFIREFELAKPKLLVLDSNVNLPREQEIFTNTNVVIIKTSEAAKNFDMYFQIINEFDRYKLNRNDTVMIIGGGVLIDVASFAASTFKRGINYIDVPTTTLAMIDSSVGSKNGLNFNNQKNLIGNITDPQKVIIDVNFLDTLDSRNWNNGIAEAIKIGYLSNKEIISELSLALINIEKVIKLCVFEKLEYVKADKYDYGYRNYLNFGHTFAHAIETITSFEKYLHGEAVSIGMVIASGYDLELIELLAKFNLPTKLDYDINLHALIDIMKGDKKNTTDKITVILKNPHKQIIKLSEGEVLKLIDKRIEVTNFAKNYLKKANQVVVPKSKSYIHRLLAVALATKSQISFKLNKDIDLSDDVLQSLNVLRSVGAVIEIENEQVSVDARVCHLPEQPIHIYKSATTYRIFTPILCSLFGEVPITLDHQLSKRPHPVFKPYINGTSHHLKFDKDYYQVDGSISSQFISGYIYAIIASNKNATIEITGQLTSAPYIDMTINIINMFGYNVTRSDQLITVNNIGNGVEFKLQSFPSENQVIDPEPDYSALSFFIVYNKLCEIHNLDNKVSFTTIDKSLQADFIISQVLDSQEIDMTDCPDLLPILIGYGLLNKRGLTLKNVSRIKFKECDRIEVMIENFKDLNAIKVVGNDLIIENVEQIKGRIINCEGDHRIAMASAIIALFSNGTFIIDDYTVVFKSYPTFWKQLMEVCDECIK